MVPHQSKVGKGGEDAVYVNETLRTLGVADGVGGFTMAGIDAGVYARSLISGCAVNDGKNPKEVVEKAIEMIQKNGIKGGSTVNLARIIGDKLVGYNVGDSQLFVFRTDGLELDRDDWHKFYGKDGLEQTWGLEFQSEIQTHYFNCPYQITSDLVDPGTEYEYGPLHPGDIIVVCSDGISDNLWPADMSYTLQVCSEHHSNFWDNPTRIGMSLVKSALEVAYSVESPTPFSVGCAKNGMEYAGGKPDDMSVAVAIVK